jgi:cell division protein FtsQ
MEPRVAERRRTVSEDRARRRLRWILLAIVVVAVVTFGFWLIRSPFLSVSSLDVSGAERSDPNAALAGLGIGVGTPTIDVRASEIERVLEADAWVASVDVSVAWPGSIVITITERVPVAPVRAGDSWVMVSQEGTVLEEVSGVSEEAPIVDIDVGSVAVGAALDDPYVSGSMVFVSALTPDLKTGAVLYREGDALYATVAGHTVRLGRPVDLEAKATVLGTLIDSGLVEGASIDLIAPLRPAVTNPQPQVEAEE